MPEDELATEFARIAREMLSDNLSLKDIDRLAREWAVNRLMILRRANVSGSLSIEELTRQNMEKIARLRERLGLGSPPEG